MKSNLKGKLVKFVGLAIMVSAVSIGGVDIYHSEIDHTKEICPFIEILGTRHQIDAINNEQYNWSNGIQAFLVAPSGHIANGNSTEGVIVITKSDVLYPENAHPGDIVHKNDLRYENQTVINTLVLK